MEQNETGSMGFTTKHEFKRDLLICPKCGSDHLMAQNKKDLLCQDCHALFSLESLEGKKQTALLLFEQAQDEIGDYSHVSQAQKDLRQARDLILSLQKKQADSPEKDLELSRLLGLIYFSLADIAPHNGGIKEIKRVLDLFKLALKEFSKSHAPRKADTANFMEGMIHDKMAVLSYNINKPQTAFKEQQKAVKSFASFLSLDSELRGENQSILALQTSARSSWMLIEHYLEQDQISQALKQAQSLLLTLTQLDGEMSQSGKLGWQDQQSLETGLARSHHLIAELISLLSEKEQEGLEDEWAKHLKASRPYYEHIEQEKEAHFLLWLGVLSPWNVMALVGEHPGAMLSQLIENPFAIDWDEMEIKEQEIKKARIQKTFLARLESFLRYNNNISALMLAKEIIQFLRKLENSYITEGYMYEFASFAFQAAELFETAGLKMAAIDLFELAAYYCHMQRAILPEQEEGILAKEGEAMACYRLGLLYPDDKVLDQCLDRALSLLRSFENLDDLQDPWMYGKILYYSYELALKRQDHKRANKLVSEIMHQFDGKDFVELMSEYRGRVYH